MITSKRIINKWLSLKEHGDVAKLAELCGKNPASMSRIIAGKQNTSTEVVLKITEFYTKRKVNFKKVEQLDQD